jgi:hypothetical protein
MAGMSGRDLALAGIPRGGTTLACRLLGGARDTVSLFEPMAVHALPADDRGAAVDGVLAFFSRTREGLLRDGTAPCKLKAGAIPDNPFAAAAPDGGARRLQVSLGTITYDPPPAPGFTLVVKHNAAFLALLPELGHAVPMLAIVRNPLAVLASWNAVDLPVSRGRLPAGERLDPELGARLDAEGDLVGRQLLLLDWCFARMADGLPAERVVRYEAMVASGGRALFDAAGVDGLADPALGSRNEQAGGAPRIAPRLLADRIAAFDGAWRAWYPRADTEALAQRMAQ